MEGEATEKRTRGRGKGSNFFAIGRDVWAQLNATPTTNRMNLLIAYLTLLAGTGSDHRLTKWSVKAIEEHTGLGKPRAKHAIEELISAGLVKRTEASTKMMPQYELPELPGDADPIFLPVALITGLKGEASMLRRVRETGDPMLLRMLIDLYGLVSLDATHGIPLENLREGGNQNNEPTARKMADVGVHAIWALKAGTWRNAGGAWTSVHSIKQAGGTSDWSFFWQRVDLLQQIGAIWYEPWAFDGEGVDAEPLMPLDPSGFYGVAEMDDEAKLTRLALDVARALISEEHAYKFENIPADFYLPLTLHRQEPALRRIARLRIEADTPGRRLSWKKRRAIIENFTQAFDQVLIDIQANRFNRPMMSGAGKARTLL